ncbi:MAG: hypothetical protein PHQ47_00570 [Candidatus Portnoybacteria bacterium]|nr:hypothetical protein [Candidatus Portnoybacteria bacterium]
MIQEATIPVMAGAIAGVMARASPTTAMVGITKVMATEIRGNGAGKDAAGKAKAAVMADNPAFNAEGEGKTEDMAEETEEEMAEDPEDAMVADSNVF